MNAPAVGEVIDGKYQVERVLGQGGMGVVLAATHLHLGSQVAIKCLLPEAVRNPEALARFVQEARTCARLRSENIVRVHDVGTLPTGTPFLVMELLEGKDLAELLVTRGPLPPDEAVAYVLQACEGLAEAHAEGIVHRDLKPSNLFVVPRKTGGRGTIKILDFGISKLMHPPPENTDSFNRTSNDALLGSPYYMSPEQITQPTLVDGRSDIWSLGVVLYELCSGRRPFLAETAPSLLGKIISEEPPTVRSHRPEVPYWIEAIVQRCLQKDPAQRYQKIQELAQALSGGANGDAFGATAAAPSGEDQQLILARRQQFLQQSTGVPGGELGARPEVCLSMQSLPPQVCLSVAPRWEHDRTQRSAGGGRRWFLGAAGSGAALALGGGAWFLLKPTGTVVIKGSSTLGQQVLPRWSAKLAHEGVTLDVTSTGTTRGIDALIAAGGDGLAAASRRATPEEVLKAKGKLVEHLVGYDAIAIVVNVNNSVPKLTLAQLRELFRGQIADWSSLGGPPGGVQLLMRPEELGGHEALRGLLGNDLHFPEGAEVVRTNDELVRRLQADPRAVSFASFTVAGPVRQVPIGKNEEGPFLAPSTSTVRQGHYPLVRPLVFYSWGRPRGAAQRFLTFARSSEAQDALLSAGFVPLH